jgi:protocatechuate 3,4-dioxygenase beta subunit
MRLPRRCFLKGLIAIVPAAVLGRGRAAQASQGGLAEFLVPTAACSDLTKLTPTVPPDGTFRSDVPERTRLMGGTTANRLVTVTGVVTGLKCGPIAKARVDFWHADPSGALDRLNHGLRGFQMTDAGGRYSLTTLRPGATPGRAPHISARVVAPAGQTLWTELFFAGEPANANDPRCRQELALIVTETGAGQSARFDFVLDL